MRPIYLTGYIDIPQNELHHLLPKLKQHIVNTREESGCLHFEVIADEAIQGRFHVNELFKDQRAFDEHQTRMASSEWGLSSRNVKRCYEIETN